MKREKENIEIPYIHMQKHKQKKRLGNAKSLFYNYYFINSSLTMPIPAPNFPPLSL